MMQMPNETWDEYKARYREAYEPLRNRIFMGTAALGGGTDKFDLSREEEDYFMIYSDDDEEFKQMDNFYVGWWITGFGFFGVIFPKATSRPVTDEEWEWFLDNPVGMA